MKQLKKNVYTQWRNIWKPTKYYRYNVRKNIKKNIDKETVLKKSTDYLTKKMNKSAKEGSLKGNFKKLKKKKQIIMGRIIQSFFPYHYGLSALDHE